ncbi:5-formyltetrahydrofolate cyclo-ligase [Tahibacter amnicola]|uniref:5-formyltetrahydrofolate cyclo-ligase n=1 Tax=Tahibacter amnicola TaxID=2976241 RepID=A0ABY6BHB6_9GAMM|nr:5-formyltetrahydrofolate cyclo-ligase [Tahibacter amnicola]UXI69167.1 5-formyltetrahydrofolate cyclo-ligase [Tahibacter amnicola]
MTEISPERHALRARMREERARLGAGARIQAAQGLMTQLRQLPELTIDQHIAGYFAVNGELSLHLVVADAWRRGRQFYLPIAGARRQLRFAPYRNDTAIVPNRFGIPEPAAETAQLVDPAAIQLVLVPLLAFDRRGNRLGYGGGFYDTSFAFLHGQDRPTEPLLVGVGYAFQEVDALDEAPWDVKLDFIATESELISCEAPQ